MQRRGAFFLTGLVFLLFAEAQRAFFASIFALAYDAAFPAFRAGAAIVAALPLVVLLLPFVPLARWVDRHGAVAVAAAGVAVFRLPMAHPALETRLVGGALVLGFFAVFLTWAVGLLDRRALTAGAVAGLVADQLLRLGGASYDLSLQAHWLPAQVVLSLALLAVAVAWGVRDHSADREGGGAGGLERRAGGMRLRGALALGPLLFLHFQVLAAPAVIARWASLPYAVVGVTTAAAGSVALALVLSGYGPTRGRTTVLGLVVMAASALAAAVWIDGWIAAVLAAVGYAATLLLVGRTLDPASGRRSGGVVSIGLAVFVVLTALYAATYFAPFTLPLLEGAAPWLVGAGLLLLAGAAVLLPQAATTTPLLRPVPGVVAAAVVFVAAAALAWSVRAPAGPRPAPEAAPLRVATLNVHYGFDQDWRFEPERVAALLAERAPDVVALQEVPVGLPIAYGIDVALWLERRLGWRGFFSPTVGGLLGEAVIARRPLEDRTAARLPGGSAGPAQVVRVRVEGVALHAVHLSVDPADRRAQAEAAVGTIGAGPAIAMGDFNAGPTDPPAAFLREAGFRPALDAAGAESTATWPAREPTERLDEVWVRGLDVLEAAVDERVVSDHRMVTATVSLPAAGRSNGPSASPRSAPAPR